MIKTRNSNQNSNMSFLDQTWEYEDSWLYCIDFLGDDPHEFDTRYRFRVRWSIPTRRKPIPRAENRYLERVFHKNNYNADFIKRNIYRPTEADATNRNPTPLTTVTIPYIKGTSETISQILQPTTFV